MKYITAMILNVVIMYPIFFWLIGLDFGFARNYMIFMTLLFWLVITLAVAGWISSEKHWLEKIK